MRGLVRPLRFVAVTVPLFFAWVWWLRDPYATVAAHVFAATARIFGQDVMVADVGGGDIRFETGDVGWVDSFGLTAVNLVPYAGLVAATAGVARARRLRMLLGGLALLAATHVLGLWTDLVHLHGHARWPALVGGLRAFVTGFGTFFFPLFIWLWFVRERLPLRARPQPARRAGTGS